MASTPQKLSGLIGAIALLSFAGAAHAETVCQGSAPDVGAEIHGPVLQVLDSERLCVALGATPDQWVEVALAPEPLQKTAAHPASRGSLMAVAFAQNITCRIVDVAGGLPLAACRLDDQSVRALTREPAAYVAGQAWR
ncbi:hypothetical protein [Phenylobacterium sp.]|uniref:hypothetical protein n=1 Tax=Phenylobacterium sp. TaxID=1871053 RepID=UPI002735C576|nr:hypothetical protein [Phenylobacterium sp.]MDP3633207.1 hypothetical protein [Phenylobacterium sp.]